MSPCKDAGVRRRMEREVFFSNLDEIQAQFRLTLPYFQGTRDRHCKVNEGGGGWIRTIELVEGRFPAGGRLAYGETVYRLSSQALPCPDFKKASRTRASE